jgi:WD40 repeat protein
VFRDGKRLGLIAEMIVDAASASYDNIVRLWDVETRTAVGSALEGHSSLVYLVAFSPDGCALLAARSYDGVLCLWDVATGSLIGRGSDTVTRRWSPCQLLILRPFLPFDFAGRILDNMASWQTSTTPDRFTSPYLDDSGFLRCLSGE